MKYATLILVGLMVTFIPLTSARADDADSGTMKEVKNAIAAFKRSNHLCPPSGEYVTLKYETYCKKWCDRGMTCHGSRATDPCAATSNSNECQQFAHGASSCLNDMNEKNALLVEYNSIVKQCHTNHALGQMKKYAREQARVDKMGEKAAQEGRRIAAASSCDRWDYDYSSNNIYGNPGKKVCTPAGRFWKGQSLHEEIRAGYAPNPLTTRTVPAPAPQVVHNQGPSCHERWLRSCLAEEQESCQPPARWVQAMQNAGEDPYASCCRQAQDTCN